MIIPSDFHGSFLLKLDEGKAQIKILNKSCETGNVSAVISGSMVALLKLLEGRVDGDALFFSRALSVEGDTEAVLTLRNAVDSADIMLEDVLIGPASFLKPQISKIILGIGALYDRAEKDFNLIHRSIVDPLNRRFAQVDNDLDLYEDRMVKMEKELRRVKAVQNKSALKTGKT